MGDRMIENANLSKIEDEYDALIAKEAYCEYKKDPKTYSLDEVKKSLGIEAQSPFQNEPTRTGDPK